jgi:hypothetical protein
VELIDRLAALVPPLRVHPHRNFGVPTRTTAPRKFPRRPGTAASGRSATFRSEHQRLDCRSLQNDPRQARLPRPPTAVVR